MYPFKHDRPPCREMVVSRHRAMSLRGPCPASDYAGEGDTCVEESPSGARVRSRERAALRSTDPVGVGVGELERHDAAVPAACSGLGDTLAEGGGIHEAVGSVSDTTGLPDDELVEVDTVVGDLEQRGAREGRTRGVDESRTVGVQALVVELDVVLQKAECGG